MEILGLTILLFATFLVGFAFGVLAALMPRPQPKPTQPKSQARRLPRGVEPLPRVDVRALQEMPRLQIVARDGDTFTTPNGYPNPNKPIPPTPPLTQSPWKLTKTADDEKYG